MAENYGLGSIMKLKVMSFNIRVPVDSDGPNQWFYRKEYVARLIDRNTPDLVGLQEAHVEQITDLMPHLPKYEWFGDSREGAGIKGERCPIFYRKDRLDLLDSGTFWLSESPHEPGSKSWRSALPRVVTWGKFRDKSSGEIFHHFNTHFDHWSRKARNKSAELMAEKIEDITGGGPSCITGDLNSKEMSKAYRVLADRFNDSRKIVESDPIGPRGTYRSFRLTSRPRSRIDYVFVSPGVRVKRYEVIESTMADNRRPSDHMPILTTLEVA